MAPKNRLIAALRMKYTTKLPGTKMYNEHIMIIRTDGMKNLYFDKKLYLAFKSFFDSF